MTNQLKSQVSNVPTNRQVYFDLFKLNNKYLTRLVIKALLNDANGFDDEISLYKHFDEECLHYDDVLKKVERVKNGEPYQYVLGYANFIDRYFYVNKNVLIPRQETEELVINTREIIKKVFPNRDLVIADIGTGSGVIAVSLKRYFPKARVIATDIYKEALDVAIKNSESQKQSIEFLLGDMVQPLLSLGVELDVLISNPPYIFDEKRIDEQVYKFEPHRALLAKPATYFYEEIFKSAAKIMKPNSLMAFEIGEDMEKPLTELIQKYFTFTNATFTFSKDMYNKTRFLYIIMQEDSHYA